MTNPKDQSPEPGRKDSQQPQHGQGNPVQQSGQQGQGREQRPGQSQEPGRQQQAENERNRGQQGSKPGMDRPSDERPHTQGQKPTQR